MFCFKKITEDIYEIGGSDRRISLFENIYPVPNGISYNSYLICDEKTALLDTVDKAISGVFFENLAEILKDRTLDYVIVNHMEPDHCALLKDILDKYPNAKLVGNEKTFTMIDNFFSVSYDKIVVKEGDSISTGKHTLSFYMAPMVHWPETMVTYDKTDKILFSADAFGSFGAKDGITFAHDVNFDRDYLDEARRYYTNIVGKYGPSVTSLLNKTQNLDIKMICPLHGFIICENINYFVEKYTKWSSYTPETDGVLVVYSSIYGGTENAANVLLNALYEDGVKNLKCYDVSKVHQSYILSDAFKYSHIVFLSVTYNNEIFPNMESLLLEICAHNLQNRSFSIVQNGSWAPTSGNKIKDHLSKLKGSKFIGDVVTIKSALKKDSKEEILKLSKEISKSIN